MGGREGREIGGRATERMQVGAVRYNVARLRLGQLLVPAAIGVTIAWRHASSLALLAVAVAVQLAAAAAFLLARRSLGRTELQVEGGKIRVGADGATSITPATIRTWTWERGVARLYGTAVTWKLRAGAGSGSDEGAAASLRAALSGVLGKPVLLARRGSSRARSVALAIAAVGVVVVVAGFVFGVPACAVVGLPAAIIGFATFGALSQKAAAASSPTRD